MNKKSKLIHQGGYFAEWATESGRRESNPHDQLIRKSVSYRTCGSTRRSVERSRVLGERWLCRGLEGDGVAEGLELADVGAHGALRVVCWSQSRSHRP